jgi:penicillin-binding protein 1C
MVNKTWFTLPPAMEFYYKAKHREYKLLPPYMSNCSFDFSRQMEIIYPEQNAVIYVPLELSGEKGKTVFKATHRNFNEKVFWHLDNNYIGTTQQFHQMALNPTKGAHTITIVDQQGETLTQRFQILDKAKE